MSGITRAFAAPALAFCLTLPLGLTGCSDDTPSSPGTGTPDVDTTFPDADTSSPQPDADPDVPTDDDRGPDVPDEPDTPVEPETKEGCASDAQCAAILGELPACQRAICDPGDGRCKAAPAEDGTSCDDGDPCTSPDQCSAGQCKAGQPKSCDDSNPCTDDSCLADTGECQHAFNNNPCNDGNLCTDMDRCIGGTCKGMPNPACQCTEDSDCAQFDDADLCNGVLICVDSQCIPDEDTVVTCEGGGDDPCTQVLCNPADGECTAKPLANGSQCDDGDACTKNDVCGAGECQGQPATCSDGNPCTNDGCDSATGCTFTPNSEPCDDGDLCTTDDTCVDGACAGTPNPECGCTSDEECAPFEDGDLCNGTLVCQGGSCVVDTATVVDCSALEATAGPCEAVRCDGAVGECLLLPALPGTLCDDGDACTGNDHCEGDVCVGDAITCADGNFCTSDSCDSGTGCVFAPNTEPCDDGDSCTDNDTCADGACVGTPTGACGCETDEDCAASEDGNLCNGTLQCVDNACVVNPATVVTCEQPTGNACVEVACVPATGTCKTTQIADGTACNDDNKCTANDFCSEGVCTGQALSCDDGNLCTTDSCAPSVGCSYVFNTEPCDDGNSCTDGDACEAGVCSGNPIQDCVCESTADCADFEDGNACNGTLICAGNKCVVDQTTVVFCDDSGDECTQNSCDPATGACQTLPAVDGKVCDDDNACTEGDACAAGACVGGQSLECDDGNPCTDDLCEPGFGCTFPPNTLPCDDGDACTQGDACEGGQCQPGDENVCPGSCQAAWTLGCGTSDTWSTGGAGATKDVSSYACSPYDYPGGEYTYRFEAPYDGSFSATLSNEETVTDLILLEGLGAGCDPANCLDYGFATLTSTMQAGQTYYLVVDGFLDDEGAYTIDVACTPDNEISCTNGADDDGDGAVDCADGDCASDPACAAPTCDPSWILECGGSDNWLNYIGGTDVIDSYSCNAFDYTGPEYTYLFEAPADGTYTVTLSDETAATDILIVGDAQDVCVADQCLAYGLSTVSFEAVGGEFYYFVVDGYLGAEGSYTISVSCPGDTPDPEICDNGTDDDGDGAADCDDSDCDDDPACEVIPVEICDNGADDDGDFLTDCEDTDCLDDPACVTPDPEICDNGTDDDGDGDADCADTDCADDPACQTGDVELDCTDGLDDDGDGFTDCLDPDCFGGADCPVCNPDDSTLAALLECPADNDTWNNGDLGSTNEITSYGCNAFTYDGPEYIYTFVPDVDSTVTVSLGNETAETDIIVLEDLGLGCNPASCVAADLDTVTFDAVGGVVYYIAVDGFLGAEGDYELSFSCGE